MISCYLCGGVEASALGLGRNQDGFFHEACLRAAAERLLVLAALRRREQNLGT
mgnify:FL=1